MGIPYKETIVNSNKGKDIHHNIIGLIPAGGRATRIAPLPCSKELYPIGFRQVDEGNSFRPKVVSHYLLEKMRLAGIKNAYIILRAGKWDIPAYFGDGKMVDMHLAYLIMDLPFGVPYTLDQAYPFVKDAIIVLGFPDVIFQPGEAYIQLLAKQVETNADIVLGLFPAYQPNNTDMVEFDSNGRICFIHIKPDNSQLEYAWNIAVWAPSFTHFMHEYILSRHNILNDRRVDTNLEEKKELHVSEVIQAAIENDMHIDTVLFKDGNFLDIGTPEDMVKTVKILNRIKEN